MIDCLIIGYNDGNTEEDVNTLRAMGASHPNYRDMKLNMIEYQGKPYRAMDIFNRFYYEGHPPGKGAIGLQRIWNHTDVLWMVIMYLGTYLSRRGFSFDYVNLFQLQKDELREKLLTNDYLSVVVTTTIYNYDTPIIEVVKFVREYSPKTKIIVGGPYVAKRSETMEEHDLKAMFKYIGGDFYVRSREGEQALVNILRCIKKGSDLNSVANIAFRQNGDFVITRSEPELNALYENLIDYSLFPRDHVGSYVNVRITKGCPFTCAFCSFPLRTEKYNVSKLNYIQQELDSIANVGTVTGLFFIDDTLNVPLGTFKDMMRMMIARNYGFKWHCFFRADFCDEELVELMKKAGCQGVFLGLESANDQVLVNMHKTPRKHHYLAAIPLFKKMGIKVFASLFFGFPSETYDTAMETIAFLEETKPDYYRPLIWYCDPVTPIWAEKDKYGIKGYHFSWSHNTMDVATACHLVERCFMRFDVPIWVPDPGFNFVSLFLLHNRGMSFDQINTFLKCFNNVVREKLIDPTRTEPSPELIENLRKSCQFDRPSHPNQEALEIFSAEEYKINEKFWFEELGRAMDSPGNQKMNNNSLVTGQWQLSTEQEIDGSLFEDLTQTYQATKSEALLAAYSAALTLSRHAREKILVAAFGSEQVFPVRLSAPLSSSLHEIIWSARLSIQKARDHRVFALRVVVNMLQMPASVIPAAFAGGYMETDGMANHADRFRFPKIAYGGLDLILRVNRGRGNGATLQFLYSSEQHSQEWVENLASTLISVLKSAAVNPDIRLEHITVEELAKHAAAMTETAPQFAF